MKKSRSPISKVLRAAVAGLWLGAAAAVADWPQWGGPGRDFQSPDTHLAESWPAAGLTTLWSRPLGEGYSGIAVAGPRLYTLYRDGGDEVVAAFATAGGEPVWEHRYEVPLDGFRTGFGAGPHSTPLVAAGRVFAVGFTARFHAFDAATGEVLWSTDLWQELGGNVLKRGYASSPIAYRDTVIVPVGGEGHAVVAFAQADGKLVWQAQDFDVSQASPILIEVDGQDQLVLFVEDEIVGLDPADGELRWRHPHKAGGLYNLSTPLWGGDNLLFLSSAYGGGSRMLRLSATAEGGTGVEEVWYQPKMRVHFTNAVWIGDHVYAATGNTGAVVPAALDARTGEIAWRSRALDRPNFLATAGGRALALDEEGKLSLVTLSPEGLEVLAEARVLESKRTYTVPSLVGDVLYLRDGEVLTAVELPLASD